MRHDFRRRAQSGLAGALALTICGLSTPASAAITPLNDGNSAILLDTGSQSGLFSWNVDGQPQSFQQWFWGRIGNVGPEFSIDTLSAATLVQPDARTLSATFQNNALRIQIIYSLLGGTPGSGSSDVSEQIRITNLTGTPMDFHFFQYVDFDLLASPGGETVQLGKNLQNKFNEAFQSDGSSAFAETVAAPGANHGQVDFFPGTLNQLNDAFPTTLNDSTLSGTGDVTWALQWDLTLQPNLSVLISKDLNLTLVPEPSMFALLSMGAIGFLIRRRRK